MTTALVTGGTGFVGRTLISLLRERGTRVVDFGPDVRSHNDDRSLQPSAIIGSVSDKVAVEKAIEAVQPEIIFHLAAFGVGGAGLIRSAEMSPLEAVQVNVLGSSVVLNAAIESGVKKFVWSSSTSVFPSVRPQDQIPSNEDVDPHPDTLYGATKRGSELLLEQLARGASTHCVGLRLPSVYGPGRYPGALAAFTRFVSDVAHSRPASISAATYAVDWLHVVDAAGALITAGQAALPRPLYNVVGHRSSLDDMANAVASHATAAATISSVASPGLVPNLMDDSRFRTEAQFTPQFDLRRGVDEYVHSEREMKQSN